MKDHQEIFEKIEDYLHHRMSDEERTIFERQIAGNELLASRVHEAKITNEAVHLAALADLRKTVADDITKIDYKPGNDWGKIFLAVIGALILLSFVIVISFTKEDKINRNEASSAIAEKKPTPVLLPQINTESEKTTEKTTAQIDDPKQEVRVKIKHFNATQSNKSEISEKRFEFDTKEPLITAMENLIAHDLKDTVSTNLSYPAATETKLLCNKEFNISIEPACENTENGKISITTDGSTNYIFQIADVTYNGTSANFTNLHSGEHRLMVNYNQVCTYTKVIKISEKFCPMNSSYSFNPDYDEKWEIKYQKGSEGMYIIFDKFGKEIYKDSFGSGNEMWDGTDLYGNKVSLGSYIGMIQYSDGRKEKVDLTIVR